MFLLCYYILNMYPRDYYPPFSHIIDIIIHNAVTFDMFTTTQVHSLSVIPVFTHGQFPHPSSSAPCISADTPLMDDKHKLVV